MSDWRNDYSIWQVRQFVNYKWDYLKITEIDIPGGQNYFNAHYVYAGTAGVFQVYQDDLEQYWQMSFNYLMIGQV